MCWQYGYGKSFKIKVCYVTLKGQEFFHWTKNIKSYTNEFAFK